VQKGKGVGVKAERRAVVSMICSGVMFVSCRQECVCDYVLLDCNAFETLNFGIPCVRVIVFTGRTNS